MSNIEIADKILGVPLRTAEGLKFEFGAYKTRVNQRIEEHAVVYKGAFTGGGKPLLVRINSACYTGDIFHCVRCDCTWQLQRALRMIFAQGGLLIYHFAHEGRGIGFVDKLKTYDVMERYGMTTHDAFLHIGRKPEERDFSVSAAILKDLKITAVRLITNNPQKRILLENNGIKVEKLVPLVNRDYTLRKYLSSKMQQFGHLINFASDVG